MLYCADGGAVPLFSLLKCSFRGPQGDGQASQQHTLAEQTQNEGHVNWREGRKWINKHTNGEEPRQQSLRLVQNAKNVIGPMQANDLQSESVVI